MEWNVVAGSTHSYKTGDNFRAVSLIKNIFAEK